MFTKIIWLQKFFLFNFAENNKMEIRNRVTPRRKTMKHLQNLISCFEDSMPTAMHTIWIFGGIISN